MKVLLLEDVYNLGRAGEVKKVANGYGRNFLLPQGFAVLATENALSKAEEIKEAADKRRAELNTELASVAEKVAGIQLLFAARAGETGKLYGSITTAMVAEELAKESGVEISKRQIDSQPLRLLGMHQVKVRLTIDLIPEFSVVVYREGEAPENYMIAAEELADEAAAAVAEGGTIEDVAQEMLAEEEAEAEADMETEAEEMEAATEEEAEDDAEAETEAEAEE